MKEVVVHNTLFHLLLSEKIIRSRVYSLASEIRMDYKGKQPIFVGILNGSFVFTSDLMRAYKDECEVTFVRLSSYKGMISTGEVQCLIPSDLNLADRHIIVVEDIIDTGKTLSYFLKDVKSHEPASVEIATLLFKPDALKHKLEIKYIGFEIPNEFVIGYGLDY